METDDHVRFGGDWRDAEREAVGEAVAASEGETASGRGALAADGSAADGSAPWVCLRVQLDGGPYFLGYRLGGGDVLKARSASELAAKIAGKLGEGAGVPVWRGGIPLYRLRKVIDFVRSHLDCPLTVAQMAEEAQMSEYHFARMFKQSLELTPLQYVTQCRMEEAERLLRTTGLKVEEVARRCGYRSASHFAERFRKRVGMRPREFRRRTRG